MNPSRFLMVQIPDHLNFDDLHLSVDSESDTLEFDCAPLREILEANADLTLTRDKEIRELIAAWYRYLRWTTNYRDEVAEAYLVSCEAAQTFGLPHLLAGPDSAH